MNYIDTIRNYSHFARFVRRHAHEIEHGLFSHGFGAELNEDVATELDEFTRITAKALGVSNEAAESACINWCIMAFAELVESKGRERALLDGQLAQSNAHGRLAARKAMADYGPAPETKPHKMESILLECGIGLTAIENLTPDDMARLAGIKLLENGGWTWAYVEYERFKLKFPGRQPEAPDFSPAEWSPAEMEIAQRENARDWEALMQCFQLFRQEKRASTTLLQNKLGFGYKRATRIIQKLESLGVISASNGIDARAVLKLPNAKAR